MSSDKIIEIIPIDPLSDSDLTLLSDMAAKIWSEHYNDILSHEQIKYMIDKYQSYNAIKKQIISDNYQYFFIKYNDNYAGYFSIHIEDNTLFLSKLYIDKDYRKKGLSSAVLKFLKVICTKNNLTKIWLTVNRNNTDSISVYKHLGFYKEKESVSDIGSGFVMDDFIMAINI